MKRSGTPSRRSFGGNRSASGCYPSSMHPTFTRRDVLAAAAAAVMAGDVGAQTRVMPTRPIPATGETLPIIGLGSTRPVTAIAERGPEPVEAVVRTLVEHGGRVIDTWPRSEANDGAFGRIISAPDLRERLFVTINLEQQGAQAGREHFERTLRLYQRETIDLVNVGSLIDLDAQWPNLRAFKEKRAGALHRRHGRAGRALRAARRVRKARAAGFRRDQLLGHRARCGAAAAAARGPRHRRADQPAVHEWRLLRALGRRAAAAVGRGARVRQLGAVFAAIHLRPIRPSPAC